MNGVTNWKLGLNSLSKMEKSVRSKPKTNSFLRYKYYSGWLCIQTWHGFTQYHLQKIGY